MARTVKAHEHAAKREEILTAARQLVLSKGVQAVSIQAVIDALQISKGAFYHYFSSKDALLEALVEQMAQGAEAQLLVVVRDASLNAMEKLRRYFKQSLKWKSAEKPLLLQLLRVWSSDENAVLRQKLSDETRSRTARLLEPILRQGIDEKLFDVAHPEHLAVFVAGLGLSMTDQLLAAMFAPAGQEQASRQLDTLLDSYADTVERMLGAPAGSLHVFQAEELSAWRGGFDASSVNNSPPRAEPKRSRKGAP